MSRARGGMIGLVLVLVLTGLALAGAASAGRVAAAPPPATFAAANYGAGNGATAVAIGDLNGDGKPDLAVANSGANTISVLINNGNGTFAAAVDYATDGNAAGVAIGDLNGDGKRDIVAGGSNGNVSVFLNNGNGTFAAAAVYSAASGFSTASDVALGDFNGDGKLDIVAANQGSAGVSVLINSGTGTFPTRAGYGTGTSTFPIGVTVGDLNSDGRPDIVSANSTDSISVLFGNGDGTFGGATKITGFDAPASTAIGDLNGDGKADLVVANVAGGPDVLSVLFGNGNGTFQAAVTYPAGIRPDSVAIADFNGDGTPDLAVSNQDFRTNTVSVLLGAGIGVFGSASAYGVGTDPSGIAVGDLNGDGRPDIVSANYNTGNVSVLLNTSPKTFTVTNALDNVNDANCTAISCTLRQAVNASNALDVGAGSNTIVFSTTVFNTAQTITLNGTYGPLMLSKNVSVTGTGANLLTIDGGCTDCAPGSVPMTGPTTGTKVFLITGTGSYAISGVTVQHGNGGTSGSGSGGAVDVNTSGTDTVMLTGVTLRENATANRGGAVATSNTTAVTIANSTLANNTARLEGGGIALAGSGSTGIVTNVTITGNTGTGVSGGVDTFPGATMTLTNATIVGNSSGVRVGGPVTATRTIVAGNTGGDVGGTLDGTSANNLIGDGTGGLTNGTNGNIVGTGIAPINPLLAPLGNYGGTAQTQPPLPGSPAFDAGGAGCSPTDQRGVARPQDTACDIGAVESQGFTAALPTGNTQSAPVTTTFPAPVGLTVSSAHSEIVNGGIVTFTITPGMGGASATFPAAGGCILTSSTVAACPINGSGIALSPAFMANTLLGSFTIIATAAGVTPTTTFTETNTPGAAATFTVSGFPSPTTAGTAGNVTVTAKDALGNIATGYTGTVHVTSSDPTAVLPPNATLTNGAGTFSVTLKTPGSQTITVTDTVTGSITGAQTGIVVNPGAAATFTVSGFPSPTASGTAGNVTVAAKDAFGNTATGYTGTVHVTSSDPTAVLPPNATLTNGAGTFSVTLKTPGSQTITVTDTVTGSITGAQTGITVNGIAPAAAADSYSLITGTTLTVPPATGVFTNDTTGTPAATLAAHTNPAHGTLTLNPDGSFAYVSTAPFVGADSFTYTLSNGNGTFGTGSSTATVTLTVNAATVTALTTTAPTGSGSGNGGTASVPILRVGGSITLSTTGTYSNGTTGSVSGISYTRYDASIVSVDANGTVTALAGGTTTITITAPNGVTTTITVTVSGGTGSGLMAPAPQPGVKAGATAAPGATVAPQPTRKADAPTTGGTQLQPQTASTPTATPEAQPVRH